MPNKNRKNTRFYKGVLENSGIAEVAYFLKHAKKYLVYASSALEGTDFTEACKEVKELSEKIDLLSRGIVSVSEGLENIERSMVREISRREFEEEEVVSEE